MTGFFVLKLRGLWPPDGGRLCRRVAENEYTYPPYTEKQATELLDGLREIVPYVVIDCGSYIANDILSAVALMEADSVLRLANCSMISCRWRATSPKV